jgi:hypothetical protein
VACVWLLPLVSGGDVPAALSLRGLLLSACVCMSTAPAACCKSRLSTIAGTTIHRQAFVTLTTDFVVGSGGEWYSAGCSVL